jgi:hypothetical protein
MKTLEWNIIGVKARGLGGGSKAHDHIPHFWSPWSYVGKLGPFCETVCVSCPFIWCSDIEYSHSFIVMCLCVPIVPVFMCNPCGIRFSSLSTLEAHQTYYCSHRTGSAAAAGSTKPASHKGEESSKPWLCNAQTFCRRLMNCNAALSKMSLPLKSSSCFAEFSHKITEFPDANKMRLCCYNLWSNSDNSSQNIATGLGLQTWTSLPVLVVQLYLHSCM